VAWQIGQGQAWREQVEQPSCFGQASRWRVAQPAARGRVAQTTCFGQARLGRVAQQAQLRWVVRYTCLGQARQGQLVRQDWLGQAWQGPEERQIRLMGKAPRMVGLANRAAQQMWLPQALVLREGCFENGPSCDKRTDTDNLRSAAPWRDESSALRPSRRQSGRNVDCATHRRRSVLRRTLSRRQQRPARKTCTSP
jgi:hypothetical protein